VNRARLAQPRKVGTGATPPRYTHPGIAPGPATSARSRADAGEHHVAVYKKIEIVGTSKASFAEAVKAAVAEASKSLRHMSWFEVVEQRGSIKDGKVNEFQVTVRVGFKVE
jgi:flavin-binding protein dodecin